MNEERKIRIFLTNGFKYQGTELPAEKGFLQLKDDSDHKIRKFPITSVSVIEVIE